jgi:ketosteroid isomerase-like protein
MLLLPLTLTLLSAVAETPAPAPGPVAASLVAAEYAFTDQAAKDGIRAAFLNALHPEGLVFIPRPVNGFAYYKTQLEFDASLQWFPVKVETSAAGDLGYTTGPWTYKIAKDAPDASYGWVVSIWQREGAAPWKVRLDIGISTPDPSELPTAPTPMARTTAALPAAPTGRPAASPELLALDQDFGRDANKKDNITNAYKNRIDAGVRFYRKGRYPLEGAAALQRYLDQYPVDFQPAEALVSGSTDLGYTRGIMTRTEAPGKTTTSYYIHVWKKVAGAWKMAVEVEVPTK